MYVFQLEITCQDLALCAYELTNLPKGWDWYKIYRPKECHSPIWNVIAVKRYNNRTGEHQTDQYGRLMYHVASACKRSEYAAKIEVIEDIKKHKIKEQQIMDL